MNLFDYIVNILLYYLAWTSCILLAAKNQGLYGAILVILIFLIQFFLQRKMSKPTNGLLFFIVILTLTGSIIDTILTTTGLIIFSSNPFSPYFAPPWIITLWMSFALLAFATLPNLFSRHILVSGLAFLGFSIAYALGVKMGAGIFPYGYKTSVLIGFIWAVMLPICFYLYQWTTKKYD